jgi:hypothetical protein
MTKLIHFFATIVYFNINSLILSDYILLKAESVDSRPHREGQRGGLKAGKERKQKLNRD